MAPEQVLNDRYRLDSVLGQGGSVWLGLDALLGRLVAVKTLHGQTPQATDHFLREARALAAIQHPGIVRILDFGTAVDGTAFMVMEHVAGLTLANRLAAGPMTDAETLSLVAAVARALSSLHAAGVVHRDVKPANIMLNPDGSIVLVDFGIATSDPATPDTDIYALGVVAYECLTGISLTEQPPPLPSAISQTARTLVTRALAESSADRWPHAEAMAQAAEPPLPTAAGFTPPARTNRMILAAGATALATLASFAVWKLTTSDPTASTTPPTQAQAAPTTTAPPGSPPAPAPPPVPEAAAWWHFSDTDASPAELTGAAHLAPHSKRNGVLVLDGNTAYASARLPDLDTTKAFTIAAWVRFKARPDPKRDITVASAPGRTTSAFFLQYKSTWGGQGWQFVMPRADTIDPPTDAAASTIAPKPGRWYFVAGVHDPATQRIILYVDGKARASAPHATTWRSRFPVRIGAHLWNRLPSGNWPGSLDKAAFYTRALTPAEIKTLTAW